MATRKAVVVEHSKKFATVKKYYPKYWNIDMVRNAVVKGWITAEEFKEITGEDYVAPDTEE